MPAPTRARARLGIPGAALLALLAVAPASGSTGVSIDTSRIAIRESLLPGGEYRLPVFAVRNPGTDSTDYTVTVTYLDGQDALRPPADWFSFTPHSLRVDPAGSRQVHATLRIPPDAVPGQYAALVGPQVASDRAGAGIAAGAAARLTFTVADAGGLEGWLRWLGRIPAEQPWLIGLVALLVAALAVWLVRRRWRFSVTRR